MMTELRTDEDDFQTLLWSIYGQLHEVDLFQKMRAKAWDHFLELGLPTRKEEVYRYVRLKSLYAEKYAPSSSTEVSAEAIDPHVLPECRQSVLVFVNGYFSPELTRVEALPKKMVVVQLAEAMRTYGSFLNNQLAKTLKEETDPFAAINAALHREGLFLYLPPKTVVETPVQVLNVIDPQGSPMYILPRLQVFAGVQSQLTLVSTQAVLSDGTYAFNIASDFALEEDAHVQFVQIACGLKSDIWHFDAVRAGLKRNSTLNTVAVTDGAATVRNDYRVMLTGENAEARLNGVWMLGGSHEAHAHVLMDHQAPNCRSMQLFKGALNDLSRSSFEGKILVRQAAQKTEAFQLNNNLLLSDRANAYSKPNLEIFADDVKASHGATVGQLDKEQIFYMKTRGFSESKARNLLVYGFCREVIDLIPVRSVHDQLIELARNYRSV